jgi:hypothetical protein
MRGLNNGSSKHWGFLAMMQQFDFMPDVLTYSTWALDRGGVHLVFC